MEQLIEFGVFAGKLVLSFLFILGLVLMVAALVMKQKMKPDLQVENINKKLQELEHALLAATLEKKLLKAAEKELKQKEKAREDVNVREPHLFVVEFKGDIHAHAVEQLRDEVTAILTIAKPGDEVLAKVESPGGVVHGYGLASAQLLRIKNAGLRLTVAVDLVAASGGYMMACTAHKIIAAPFAILGSIGVIAQVPNFYKLLKKHDVDYEEISSGEYKRTVSLLGEITEKGREKFKEQIVDTHELFKSFVHEARPQLDLAKVATGEYWFGIRAKELNLIDEVMTSDEYLLKRKDDSAIFKIKIDAKKTLGEKIGDIVGYSSEKIMNKIEQKFIGTPPV